MWYWPFSVALAYELSNGITDLFELVFASPLWASFILFCLLTKYNQQIACWSEFTMKYAHSTKKYKRDKDEFDKKIVTKVID